MLNPGQRRADRAGDRSPGPAPQSPAGGTALKASPLPSPPPPCEVPPDLSLSTTGPVSAQPAGAPSPGRATHGLLPLIVRRSPLRSRTLECSPADAISRTCSTTLIPAAENRGAEGTDGKEADNAAAARPPALQNGATGGSSRAAACRRPRRCLHGGRAARQAAGRAARDGARRARPPAAPRLRSFGAGEALSAEGAAGR